MKANIIHSDYYQERLPRLLNELEKQGIGYYELWEGIVDKHSTKKGINLSHKQIVEYAKLADWDEVLIMEDDVRFCGEGAFDYFLESKPKEFDLYLSGIYLGEILPNNTVKSFSGLHCYVVHSRFYDKFLNTPNDEHIDRILSNLGEYKVCNPFAAIQYNGFSSNTRKEENYDYLLQDKDFYNNFSIK